MNSKTAKKLRRFAEEKGLPYKKLKKIFNQVDWITRSKILEGVINDGKNNS